MDERIKYVKNNYIEGSDAPEYIELNFNINNFNIYFNIHYKSHMGYFKIQEDSYRNVSTKDILKLLCLTVGATGGILRSRELDCCGMKLNNTQCLGYIKNNFNNKTSGIFRCEFKIGNEQEQDIIKLWFNSDYNYHAGVHMNGELIQHSVDYFDCLQILGHIVKTHEKGNDGWRSEMINFDLDCKKRNINLIEETKRNNLIVKNWKFNE